MPAGVYLHIPFCKSRCSYCDFAIDIYRSEGAVERYVEALCKEIGSFNQQSSKSKNVRPIVIDTIYFGGGTPSLLSPHQVETILSVVQTNFIVESGAEITMEMNPATVTPESLRRFRSRGGSRWGV